MDVKALAYSLCFCLSSDEPLVDRQRMSYTVGSSTPRAHELHRIRDCGKFLPQFDIATLF